MSNPSINGFFVILREDDLCLHRHESERAAHEEAKRLAKIMPGNRFYVLYSQKAYRVPDPVIVEECEFELPF